MSKQTVNGRRVISLANLPMRMPLWHTLTLYLFLDRLSAPGWAWGAGGLFIVLAWLIWIRTQFTDVKVDVLANKVRDEESPSDRAYMSERGL